MIGRLTRAAAVAAVLLLAAGGCGDETILKSTPDGARGDSAPKAGVGDTITLTSHDGKIAVTLVGIIDPVIGHDFDTPPAGTRYIGLRIRLRNLGQTTTYDDAPANSAELTLSNDAPAEQTHFMIAGPCSGRFTSDAKVRPGKQLTGCLPYEVERGLHPKRLRFTLDSGYGPDTGEWTIPLPGATS